METPRDGSIAKAIVSRTARPTAAGLLAVLSVVTLAAAPTSTMAHDIAGVLVFLALAVSFLFALHDVRVFGGIKRVWEAARGARMWSGPVPEVETIDFGWGDSVRAEVATDGPYRESPSRAFIGDGARVLRRARLQLLFDGVVVAIVAVCTWLVQTHVAAGPDLVHVVAPPPLPILPPPPVRLVASIPGTLDLLGVDVAGKRALLEQASFEKGEPHWRLVGVNTVTGSVDEWVASPRNATLRVPNGSDSAHTYTAFHPVDGSFRSDLSRFGDQLFTLTGHQRREPYFATSTDYLVYGSYDSKGPNAPERLHLATREGRDVRVLDEKSEASSSPRFSPDGKHVAWIGIHTWGGQTAHVADVQNGKVQKIADPDVSDVEWLDSDTVAVQSYVTQTRVCVDAVSISSHAKRRFACTASGATFALSADRRALLLISAGPTGTWSWVRTADGSILGEGKTPNVGSGRVALLGTSTLLAVRMHESKPDELVSIDLPTGLVRSVPDTEGWYSAASLVATSDRTAIAARRTPRDTDILAITVDP